MNYSPIRRARRKRKRGLRMCDAAILVLRETENPAVMWGDEGLLHMIAERAESKVQRRGPKTSDAVLNTLAKCPGDLVKRLTRAHGRPVLIFYLPEVAKERGIT